MNKECQGCYLIRIILSSDPPYDVPPTPDQISCQHEDLPCPCKTCLVKITCDTIEIGSTCQTFIDFNLKYNKNHYWEKQRKEKNV